MTAKQFTFASALRAARTAGGFSQEALSEFSSRTYVSALERGLKSPTLHKVDQFADILEMHPLTLLVMAYSRTVSASDVEQALSVVHKELQAIRESRD